jgi:hypothetical protein
MAGERHPEHITTDIGGFALPAADLCVSRVMHLMLNFAFVLPFLTLCLHTHAITESQEELSSSDPRAHVRTSDYGQDEDTSSAPPSTTASSNFVSSDISDSGGGGRDRDGVGETDFKRGRRLEGGMEGKEGKMGFEDQDWTDDYVDRAFAKPSSELRPAWAKIPDRWWQHVHALAHALAHAPLPVHTRGRTSST